MNWKVFLQSVAAAAIGGAATTAYDVVANGASDPMGIGKAAAGGALLAVLFFLKASPIQPKTTQERPLVKSEPIQVTPFGFPEEKEEK